MNPSTRLKAGDGIVAQQAHGQTVLLRMANGGYYVIDEVGEFIWSLLDGTRTAEDLVDSVTAEFDAPRDSVRGDVAAFLAELADERLVDAIA